MSAHATWRRRFGAAVSVSTAVVLGITTVGTAPAADAGKARKLKRAARIAVNQVGDPYVYGANGPGSFDCSGLTSFSYHKAGLRLPRTSSSQARYTRNIRRRNLRRGDLLFFYSGSKSSSNVYHVAMFLRRKHGNVRMIEAPSTGHTVHRTRPWSSRWFAGTVR